MAFNAQIFTRVGGTPDLLALATAIRQTLGDPFYVTAQLSSAGVVTLLVEKPAVWTAPQITAVQSAVTAAATSTPQIDGQNDVDNWPPAMRGLVVALVKQLNTIRAALPAPLGALTAAQVLTAIRTETGNLP